MSVAPISISELIFVKKLSFEDGYDVLSYKDTKQNEWIINKALTVESFSRFKNMATAYRLYKLMGAHVPETFLDTTAKCLAIKTIKGKLLSEASPDEFKIAMYELYSDFYIDILVSNKSVVPKFILLPTSGDPPVRMSMSDVYEFTEPVNEVPELDTFRSGTDYPEIVSIFKNLPEGDIEGQVQYTLADNKYTFLEGLDSKTQTIMKQRINYLLNKYKSPYTFSNTNTTNNNSKKKNTVETLGNLINKMNLNSNSNNNSNKKNTVKKIVSNTAPNVNISTLLEVKNMPSFLNLSYNSNLGGSTGTKLYKNTASNKWVVKKAEKGGGYEQIISEAITNAIYQSVGIPVPKFKLDPANNALILQYIDGKLLSNATSAEVDQAKIELSKGFIMDALLANWDVIGLGKNNIILPSDGSPPVRIDNGGSLTFRAQGGPKPFTDTVEELETMRNKKTSPQAASIFGHLTDDDIHKQIKTIIQPNVDIILSLTPSKLKPTMKKRIEYLLNKVLWADIPKNNVMETETPEYIEPVQKALVDFFKDGWVTHVNSLWEEDDTSLIEYINTILKENNAVIGGGFILKAIGGFQDESSIDIDIYVPSANITKFKASIVKLFNPDTVEKHNATDSDTSFFKKNGIKSVTKYMKKKPEFAGMDIVEVVKEKTPINAVKNADLSFCQNWYDGETIYMVYPEHVKTKKGFLENNYLGMYYQNNEHLLRRMKKYIKRGFRIKIQNPSTKSVENVTNIVNAKQIVVNTSKTRKQASYTNTKVTNVSTLQNNTTIPNSIQYIKKNTGKNVIPTISSINENSSSTILKLDASDLTKAEYLSIYYYTGSGYDIINRFLYSYGGAYIPLYGIDKSIEYIKKKVPKAPTEADDEYDNRLMYYLFVNTFNAIIKAPRISPMVPFMVYRGTSTAYLLEDNKKFYYLNSFTSTSTSTSVIKGFGGGYTKYLFYALPNCFYANVQAVSSQKGREKEILFTPYHRYLYLDSEIVGSTTYKRFILFPPDISIPTNFNDFYTWKSSVASITKNIGTLSGGRMKIEMPTNLVAQATVKATKNIMKKLNTKTRRNTPHINKMYKSAEMNVTQNTRKRNMRYGDKFTAPIPSFPGNAPNEQEQKIIQAIRALVKK